MTTCAIAMMSLREAYQKYKDWVSANAQSTSDIESTIKWVSYLMASRYEDSSVLSEFILSLSNLLVLFNDRIIYLSLPNSEKHNRYENNLKVLLTVLEHCEVFIEISARKMWGNYGKWIVVFCIQLFKCISRMKLLYYYKEAIVENPPISRVQRKELDKIIEEMSDVESFKPEGFVLKSGKVIRRIDATAQFNNKRSWKALELRDIYPISDKPLNTTQFFAETMYVIKPLVHLGSIYCFGDKAWKPWLLALTLDVASLHLMKKKDADSLNKRQKVELTRRYYGLLMYLVRSPFYDIKSKQKIHSFLETLSDKVPAVGLILRPLNEYIPQWQQTYFYMWSV